MESELDASIESLLYVEMAVVETEKGVSLLGREMAIGA
jgi:hypothetical protein